MHYHKLRNQKDAVNFVRTKSQHDAPSGPLRDADG